MSDIEEINPLERQILRIYARKYGMSEDSFYQELMNAPGDTFTDKLREYINLRKGVNAYANLLTVYKEQPYPREDGSVRYRLTVRVYLPEDEQNRLAAALGLSEEEKSILDLPYVTMWISDKKLVDRIRNIPAGSRVLLSNISVARSDSGGVFINVKNIIDKGIDVDFLRAAALKPGDLKDQAIEEGHNVFLDLQGASIIPDPTETTTAKGDQKVRIYVDDIAQVDIIGPAFTRLKQLGDPYTAEFWQQFKDKPLFLRAVYWRDVAGFRTFTVNYKPDVIIP